MVDHFAIHYGSVRQRIAWKCLMVGRSEYGSAMTAARMASFAIDSAVIDLMLSPYI